MKIVLVGMMGCGKSTIGKDLAKKLNYHFYDSDIEIEKIENTKIKSIFTEKGEEYFRKIESETIRNLIKAENSGNIVIALGGGAFINKSTREFLKKENTKTVWLKASTSSLMERLKKETSEINNIRPLLQINSLQKTLEELSKKRDPIYKQADLIISTDNKNIKKIIAEIKMVIKN